MKVLAKSNPGPISVAPGDTITLSYNEDLTVFGRRVFRSSREVLRRTIDRRMTVDECAVVEFSPSELKKQGWKDAIGGVFAERA